MAYDSKRAIAALIICFKPHVFLTLCILLVIVHSMIIAIKLGANAHGWRILGINSIGVVSLARSPSDMTLTMATLLMITGLIWATFFIFIVKFELRNELDSLLVLFQCSKRGLRFLGVIGFHMLLLAAVALSVSFTVQRSIPGGKPEPTFNNSSTEFKHAVSEDRNAFDTQTMGFSIHRARKTHLFASEMHSVKNDPGEQQRVDRSHLLTVYTIWLTAIIYAFLYLVFENIIMFYEDMSLVEFVHEVFLRLVTQVTGIDLSDYPAGEMLFNPLVRNRIR